MAASVFVFIALNAHIFWILDCRVVRFNPRRTAAPPRPGPDATRFAEEQLHTWSARNSPRFRPVAMRRNFLLT